MTSQSLRKHRITRSNILQKVTTKLQTALASGGKVVCVLGLGLTSGFVLADDVAPRADTDRAAIQDANETLQQSRALLRSLRLNRPVASPAASPSAASPSVRPLQAAADVPSPVPAVPTARQLQSASSALAVNPILLTSGEDESVGAITIPNLVPTIDDASDDLFETEDSDGVTPAGRRIKNIQRYTGADGTVYKRNLRRGTTKVVRSPSSNRFIQFYDPEEEDFDEEDYHMPVLLVGATDEQPAAPPAEDKTGLLSRRLSDIKPTLNYAWGDWKENQLPDDFHERMDNGAFEERIAPRTVYQWAPTNLWYHPLYFQDVGLERYGHTRKPWIQPFVSSGKFFGQVVGLPYQMALHPPKSREFALGYYQPGEWAPKKRYQVPFNEEAAATEFLWVTGFILLIP